MGGKASGWTVSRQLQVRLYSECEGHAVASREGAGKDLGPYAKNPSTIFVDWGTLPSFIPQCEQARSWVENRFIIHGWRGNLNESTGGQIDSLDTAGQLSIYVHLTISPLSHYEVMQVTGSHLAPRSMPLASLITDIQPMSRWTSGQVAARQRWPPRLEYHIYAKTRSYLVGQKSRPGGLQKSLG